MLMMPRPWCKSSHSKAGPLPVSCRRLKTCISTSRLRNGSMPKRNCCSVQPTTRMYQNDELSRRGHVMSNLSISPTTEVGPVSLTIADLDRSIRFYEDVLGLKLMQYKGHTAIFGGDMPLLLITEQPGARPRPLHTTGLYHFAILVPGRANL